METLLVTMVIGNPSARHDHTVNTRPSSPVARKRSTLDEEMTDDDDVYLGEYY